MININSNIKFKDSSKRYFCHSTLWIQSEHFCDILQNQELLSMACLTGWYGFDSALFLELSWNVGGRYLSFAISDQLNPLKYSAYLIFRR